MRTNLDDENITVTQLTSGWKYKKYKIYEDGNVEEYKSILPEGYQELEYIESTGTQWIDTLFLPQKEIKYKFIADFQLTDFSKDRQTIMGNDTCDIRIDSNGYIFGNTNNPYIGLNRHSISIEVLKLQNGNFRFNFNCDGFEWTGEWSYWLENKIAIFTNIAHIQQMPKAKLYSANIYNNDVHIRNFIPCYSTTTVTDVKGKQCPSGTRGLYDLVEGKFYTNANTAEDAVDFIAGPEL